MDTVVAALGCAAVGAIGGAGGTTAGISIRQSRGRLRGGDLGGGGWIVIGMMFAAGGGLVAGIASLFGAGLGTAVGVGVAAFAVAVMLTVKA